MGGQSQSLFVGWASSSSLSVFRALLEDVLELAVDESALPEQWARRWHTQHPHENPYEMNTAGLVSAGALQRVAKKNLKAPSPPLLAHDKGRGTRPRHEKKAGVVLCGFYGACDCRWTRAYPRNGTLGRHEEEEEEEKTLC